MFCGIQIGIQIGILPPLLLEEVRHMCFQDLITVGIHTAGDTKHSFVFLSLFLQSD